MRYRVAIITKDGKHFAENFVTRGEVDEFVLKHDVKRYRILDKELNKIIETEKGVVK